MWYFSLHFLVILLDMDEPLVPPTLLHMMEFPFYVWMIFTQIGGGSRFSLHSSVLGGSTFSPHLLWTALQRTSNIIFYLLILFPIMEQLDHVTVLFFLTFWEPFLVCYISGSAWNGSVLHIHTSLDFGTFNSNYSSGVSSHLLVVSTCISVMIGGVKHLLSHISISYFVRNVCLGLLPIKLSSLFFLSS